MSITEFTTKTPDFLTKMANRLRGGVSLEALREDRAKLIALKNQAERTAEDAVLDMAPGAQARLGEADATIARANAELVIIDRKERKLIRDAERRAERERLARERAKDAADLKEAEEFEIVMSELADAIKTVTEKYPAAATKLSSLAGHLGGNPRVDRHVGFGGLDPLFICEMTRLAPLRPGTNGIARILAPGGSLAMASGQDLTKIKPMKECIHEWVGYLRRKFEEAEQIRSAQ